MLALPAAVAAAQTRVLVVTGLGAEAKYHDQFMSLGDRLTSALHDRYSIADSNIAWLGEDSTAKSIRYRGRRPALEGPHLVSRILSRTTRNLGFFQRRIQPDATDV